MSVVSSIVFVYERNEVSMYIRHRLDREGNPGTRKNIFSFNGTLTHLPGTNLSVATVT